MCITRGGGRGDLTVPATPGGVSRTVLPGGLRVLTETRAGRPLGVARDLGGVGSRDETPARGRRRALPRAPAVQRHPRGARAAEIAEAFDAVGGELNAFTAKEHTCFYAHVLDTDLPMAVDVLADVVTDAVLDPAHVELERNVVLEEIAIRDDDPEDLLGELFDEALFGDHPLGRPIVGTEDSVRAMDRAALHEFWRSRYTTPRMVVAAAGQPAPRARRGPRRGGAGRRRGAGRPRRRARPLRARRPARADGGPPGAAARRQRAGAPHDRRARPVRGTTRGAPRCRCSAPRSAAAPARGCSSRSASSAGWRTRCTPRRRATPTPAASPSTPAAGPSGSARSRRSCAACSRTSPRTG